MPPRVQELTIDNNEISLKALQSLWFHTTLLLPNLKRLDWIYHTCEEVTLIRPLLHLRAWLDDGDHLSVMGFLECCHILCPNLKSLYVSRLDCSPHVTAAVSRAISRTKNLRALSCGPLVKATLMHIIGSRQLESLEASLQDCQSHDLRMLAVHGNPPFENLRVLELHFQDLPSIILYLRSHNQLFEYICFNLDTTPTPEVLRKLFTALESPMRQRTLRQIHLAMFDEEDDPPPLQAIDFQVLSLLTNLCIWPKPRQIWKSFT